PRSAAAWRRATGGGPTLTLPPRVKLLACALQNVNGALLAEVRAHYRDPRRPYPAEDSALMYELTEYLEAAGISDPLTKIYMTTTKFNKFALLHFLFATSQLQQMVYNRDIGTRALAAMRSERLPRSLTLAARTRRVPGRHRQGAGPGRHAVCR